MADVDGEDEIEDYLDMEGVQREGLFDSRHALPAGEPDYMIHSAGTEKGQATRTKNARRRELIKAKEEKGKAKEVVGVIPIAKGQPKAILKRPETVAAEAAADAARWGRASLSVIE
jgi:hypothetical protein